MSQAIEKIIELQQLLVDDEESCLKLEQLKLKLLGLHPLTAKLTYFKYSGKYYSSGEMNVSADAALYEIWDDIVTMFGEHKRPGLLDGEQEFITLVEVPGHKHEHPHLIMPKRRET